jgi:hypothetical protein
MQYAQSKMAAAGQKGGWRSSLKFARGASANPEKLIFVFLQHLQGEVNWSAVADGVSTLSCPAALRT